MNIQLNISVGVCNKWKAKFAFLTIFETPFWSICMQLFSHYKYE
jgi:hypothetical protein